MRMDALDGDTIQRGVSGLGEGLAPYPVGVVSQFLYGITAQSPWPYVVSGCVLTTVAVGASLAPALRAARVDPVRSLRTE